MNSDINNNMNDNKTLRESPFDNEQKKTSEGHASQPNSKNRLIYWLSGFLFFAVGFLAFLFSAHTLTIQSNAKTFQTDVDGWFTVSIPTTNRFLVLAGKHQVSINASGYVEFNTSIVIDKNKKDQQLQVELTPLPGHLKLNLAEHSPRYQNDKISVSIEGKPTPIINNTLSNLAAGKHQINITSSRYNDWQQTVQIEGRNTTQILSVELQPNWVDVAISSIPSQASIWINAIDTAQAPTTIELLGGSHQITLKAEGYKDWNKNITVERTTSASINLPAITLEPADGILSLISEPIGAHVMVAGLYQGETPIKVTVAPDKLVKVALFKEGYKSLEQQIMIESGEIQEANFTLPVILGRANITTQPADAELYINNKRVNSNNGLLTITLPSYPHKITAKKSGYADLTKIITPRSDRSQALHLELQTIEHNRWQQVSKEITSPIGQQLILLKPNHTFMMGASRREQGRQANQAQHQVELNRAFYIAPKLVTNADFRKFKPFFSAGHHQTKSLNGEHQPVVNIAWVDAAKYCNWLSEQQNLELVYQFKGSAVPSINVHANGYRMPTETEWAWATRLIINSSLSNSVAMKKYPWPSERNHPENHSANYADTTATTTTQTQLPNYHDKYAASSPVASYAPNHNGLYDTAGNVAEWMNDFYQVNAGLTLKIEPNPTGPSSGDMHVIRGSSWQSGSLSELRLAYRRYGVNGQNDVGFRLARNL